MTKAFIQGGFRASRFGRLLEDDVEAQFVSSGLVKLSDKEKKRLKQGLVGYADLGPAWYVRNAKMFKNIYGVEMFSDFFVYHEEHAPSGLLLEVKSQESPGSIDEKYVFTVLSLLEQRGIESWLVFEGDGARKCSIDWMKKQSESRSRFTFMTFAEFRRNVFERFR